MTSSINSQQQQSPKKIVPSHTIDSPAERLRQRNETVFLDGTRISLYDDQNLEGYAEILLGAIASKGWLDLLPIQFIGRLLGSMPILLWDTSHSEPCVRR
jgi:hypothetical protein